MELRLPSTAHRALLVATLLIPQLAMAQSSGLTAKYCSTQNTAGNYNGVSDTYQSAGNCRTQCESSYAFAVLQNDKCWCSNYIPASTVSTSNCNVPCPGYPDDKCGNLGSGLYGYIALNVAPSGTAGAQPNIAAVPLTSPSTSSSSTSSSSSTTQLQSSSVSRATSPIQDPDKTTIVSILTLSQSTSSTSSSTSSSISSSTPDPSTAAVTSVQVVTVSGAVVFKTVTSTPIPAPAQDNTVERIQHEGLSGGTIAGIIIGVLAGVAIVALAAFLLWRRRRARDDEVTNEKGGRSPRRNISVLSRSGLMSRGTHDNSNERDFDEPINAGYNSQRHSMLFGAGATSEGVSPSSVLETSNSGDSRRHSKPMVYDQRLNPSALFATHDNGSRTSMQDGADYSRTLGVTNPDPRASFDSRLSTA